MSTGWKFNKAVGVFLLCLGALCLGMVSPANAESSQSQPTTKTKTKKPQKPLPPPLPSGPTGPVQQVPLDSMAPVPPQVNYQNAQLTIVATNSTLGDILRAVRKQTGAEIEIPVATERVVTHLGPGPARDVIAELLNGSRFNYVLLGSPADSSVLTRVVLVAKTGPDANPNAPEIAEQKPGMQHPGISGAPGIELDPNGAEANQENTDDAADQAAAEAEQPPAPSDQPGVKTPQQMLQDMQQRQLQLQQQQQQQPGQPPVPAPVVPPQPPPQQQ